MTRSFSKLSSFTSATAPKSARTWWQRDGFLLALLWAIAAVFDRLWFALDRASPLWDQSDHLSRAMSYWHHLQQPHLMSGEWWTQLWLFSPGYRAPFVYLLTAPFFQLLGAGHDQAGCVNLLFSAIAIGAIYHLGKQLFSAAVGMWAAALFLTAPYLAELRTDYWLDYGLIAVVTLVILGTTHWRTSSTLRQQWWWTCFSGLSAGLVLLTKPTGLLFFVVPFLWLLGTNLRDRQWLRCLQIGVASGLALLVVLPWFRTNWLTIFTSGHRAAVGMVPLAVGSRWLFYITVIPELIPWVVLIPALIGTLIGAIALRRQWLTRGASGATWRWWGVLLLGTYATFTTLSNRTTRHVVPMLPVLLVGVAYGLMSWPRPWGRYVRWGTAMLASVACALRLFPIPGAIALDGRHLAYTGVPWPHEELVREIETHAPHLISRVGIATNTAEINAFTLNYYSKLAGTARSREIGFGFDDLPQDLQAFDWYVTKTGAHGPSQDNLSAQAELRRAIASNPDLQLWRTWSLPDDSELHLFRRRQSPIQAKSIESFPNRVRCDRMSLPRLVSPNTTVPMSTTCTGRSAAMRSGLLLMSWISDSPELNAPPWWNDRAIASGQLAPQAALPPGLEIRASSALWVPTTMPEGRYHLQVTYLNRETGEHYSVAIPDTAVHIKASSPDPTAPQLNFITQLRQLGEPLAAGDLEAVFAVVGRLNQYDAEQDYLKQAERSLQFRLEHHPEETHEFYALGLARVLQRKVRPAIETFTHLTEIDAENPYAWTYLGFVNLYRWHPREAESALNRAHELAPDLPNLDTLRGVAALMQLDIPQAFQLLG